MPGHRLKKQRVFEAGETFALTTLQDDHRLRFVDIKNRHARNWTARIFTRVGIDDVVCADDDGNISGGELGIDLFEFVKRGIGNIRFGQQHVHMAGHASRNWMNSVFDSDAALLENIRQLTHSVLRLGCGQSITRHEDDFVRIGELGGDVLETDFAHRSLLVHRCRLLQLRHFRTHQTTR